MDKLKRTGLVVACCLLNVMAMAQNNSQSGEAGDFMRSNGKIYVVVVVAGIIITGLFLYLLNLERKIKKLEKEYR